jgi:hypothetical protein
MLLPFYHPSDMKLLKYPFNPSGVPVFEPFTLLIMAFIGFGVLLARAGQLIIGIIAIVVGILMFLTTGAGGTFQSEMEDAGDEVVENR